MDLVEKWSDDLNALMHFNREKVFFGNRRSHVVSDGLQKREGLWPRESLVRHRDDRHFLFLNVKELEPISSENKRDDSRNNQKTLDKPKALHFQSLWRFGF